VRCGPLGKVNIVAPKGTPIRSALQQNRELAVGIGTKDIATKHDSITHSYGDATLDLNGIIFDSEKMRRYR